jgi:hypothetical protein
LNITPNCAWLAKVGRDWGAAADMTPSLQMAEAPKGAAVQFFNSVFFGSGILFI